MRVIDYHVHSSFSDGEETIEKIIDVAIQRGIEELAITDHYDPYDENLRKETKDITGLIVHFNKIRDYAKGKPIKVYCGIETCTDEIGNLRLEQECMNQCDLIITSPHYVEGNWEFIKGNYFYDKYWEAYKKKLLHMASGSGHVLGHMEGYLPIKKMLLDGTTYEGRKKICAKICDKYFDPPFILELGTRLKASGKAVELHGATGTPREWVVKYLGSQGITFSIGSDAHSLMQLGKNEWGVKLTRRYQLKLIQPTSKFL